LSRGAETTLGGEYALSGAWLFAWAFEYSLQISEDTSPNQPHGRHVPRIPQEKGSARLGLRVPSKFAFHLNGSYTGFRYLNRANTKYLDEYFLLDAVFDLDIASWMKIKLVVHNIFDTAYVHLREYPVPGREWAVSMEVRL
jgi:outer membrane cobalamin receptor